MNRQRGPREVNFRCRFAIGMAAGGAEACEAGRIDDFGALATSTTVGIVSIAATVRLVVRGAIVEFAMICATIGLTTVDSGAGVVAGVEAFVLG